MCFYSHLTLVFVLHLNKKEKSWHTRNYYFFNYCTLSPKTKHKPSIILLLGRHLRSEEWFPVRLALVEFATLEKLAGCLKSVSLNIKVLSDIMALRNPVAKHFFKLSHLDSTSLYTDTEAVKWPWRGCGINNLVLKHETYWIYTLDTV